MSSWLIRWNFDKQSYSPGEFASVDFWLENTGDVPIHLSELKMVFEFGEYHLYMVGGIVYPRKNEFLGHIRLQLPIDVVGKKLFALQYRIHELINNKWEDLGQYESDKQYFISIYPQPFYKVFVSRGLGQEDRALGDPITEMIKEWGLDTLTVGIDIKVPEDQVAFRVREEIRTADALVAIATPRYIDALTGLVRTLEWLHGEVGIAFGVDKPILILKDKRVSLGGLPSYIADLPQNPVIEFNPYKIDEVKAELSTVMPGFREWIDTKRREEFFGALGKLAIGGLAIVGGVAILSGIVGALAGTSKR